MSRVAISRREFMAALGVSRNFVRRLEREGTLRAVKLGGKVFIPTTELLRLGLQPANERKEGGL